MVAYTGMTRNIWTESDLDTMMMYIDDYYKSMVKVWSRKLRLFACHCCFEIVDIVNNELLHSAVLAVYDYADNKHHIDKVQKIREDWVVSRGVQLDSDMADHQDRNLNYSIRSLTATSKTIRDNYLWHASNVAAAAYGLARSAATMNTFSCIFRDIINPFEVDTKMPNDVTVRNMAKTMYIADDFSNMPILGDAIEDTGYTNQYVLNHCRDKYSHYRGCWVIDKILGKK